MEFGDSRTFPPGKDNLKRYPSGHILKVEWDSEIKIQDAHTRHLRHVCPKGKIFKDELDLSIAGILAVSISNVLR